VITPCGGGGSAAAKGCRVYRTTSVALPNITWTELTFNAEHFDYGGYFDLAGGGPITIPAGESGLYLVIAGCWFEAHNAGFRYFQVTKNADAVNVDPIVYDDRSPFSTVTVAQSVIAAVANTWPLVAGDTLHLHAFQSSGTTINATGNVKLGISLGVTKLGT
jgi:hypothetical protein